MIPIYLSDIAKASAGRLKGADMPVWEISTDSRKIGDKCLFIPLKGERFDGHDFINTAAENGAVSYITHNKQTDGFGPNLAYPGKLSYIEVKDTRRALLDIAAYYRRLFDIKAAAVTGSAGKTAVKNGIASVLSQKYKTLKTEGNLNNEIGLPLTVFNLDDSYRAAVFEMGMNSFGEISNLSKTAKPDVSVITNIGYAHLEGLKSREGILKAKLEIIDGMSEKGTLILNYDDDMLRQVKGPDIMWFSACEKADVYAETAAPNLIEIHYGKRTVQVFVEITERRLVANLAAAAATGFLFGLSDNEIKEGIENIPSDKGRLCIVKGKNGITVIDDTYNANPDSMKLAIDVLMSFRDKEEQKETLAVLGDMLELGELSERLHEETGAYAALKGVDTLIAVGSQAKSFISEFNKNKKPYQKSFHFESVSYFLDAGLSFTERQIVLVKASRGMKLEDVVQYLKF